MPASYMHTGPAVIRFCQLGIDVHIEVGQKNKLMVGWLLESQVLATSKYIRMGADFITVRHKSFREVVCFGS